MGAFETDDRHANPNLRPVRVPMGSLDVLARARELCDDLGWQLLEAEEGARRIRYQRAGGLLGGQALIEVRVEGPEGIPSSTTHVRCQASGGLFAPERRIVREFVKKFTMRVT